MEEVERSVPNGFEPYLFALKVITDRVADIGSYADDRPEVSDLDYTQLHSHRLFYAIRFLGEAQLRGTLRPQLQKRLGQNIVSMYLVTQRLMEQNSDHSRPRLTDGMTEFERESHRVVAELALYQAVMHGMRN